MARKSRFSALIVCAIGSLTVAGCGGGKIDRAAVPALAGATGVNGPTGSPLGPTGVQGPTGVAGTMPVPMRVLCPQLVGAAAGPSGADGSTGASDPALAEPGPRGFRPVGPVLMTESELQAESVRLGTSIYWVGRRDGYQYEFWRDRRGFVFLRYLPEGTAAGTPGADYLVVGTYPLPVAYADLCWIRDHEKIQALDGPGGGLYLVARRHRRSVYVAFRGVDYEIEVYDPNPAAAATIASSGRVRPVTG